MSCLSLSAQPSHLDISKTIVSSISTSVQFTWKEVQGEEADCSQLLDVATPAGQNLRAASLAYLRFPDHAASQPAASAVTLT